MQELTGKTAFVTGAASGIGLGIATALARAGVKVMLCDIEHDSLARAVETLKSTNADVAGVRADVSLKDELARAAEAVIAQFGKLHILVSNAGVGGGSGPYGLWSAEAWDWTLGVNLMGMVWGVEIFCPLIEAHGAGRHIVATASIAGLVSLGSTPYNASKYGVVGLFEGLRTELAPRGIVVSILCPGFTRTRIAESIRNLPPRFDHKKEEVAKTFGSPRHQAMRDGIAHGVDPLYVGELVREGIENDWPYIFTDTQFEPMVEVRFAEIRKGFEDSEAYSGTMRLGGGGEQRHKPPFADGDEKPLTDPRGSDSDLATVASLSRRPAVGQNDDGKSEPIAF